MGRTRVLVLRHAETARPDVFHGAESDIELSARGVRQATAVASILAAERPVAVVSSGMRRAIQTADPIARACAVPLEIEQALHERRVGVLSGTPTSTPNNLWDTTIARWSEGDLSYAPPGAESFLDIRNRILPVWDRITRKYHEQCIVLVAHGAVIRVLLIGLLPEMQPFAWHSIGIANVAIHELEWTQSRWKCLRLNDNVISTP